MEEELEKEEQEKQPDAVGDRVAGLEQTVAAKDAQIARLMQANVDLEKRAAALGDSLAKAVAGYRTMVVRANPEVIEELISGDSIETIDESLVKGKELVDRVKRGVEAAVSRTRVPAGAPERTPPDLSALSAREKIQYAIGKSSK